MIQPPKRLRELLVFGLAGVSLLGGCGGPAYRESAHMRRGQAYLDKGDYAKARIEFRNALQIKPNDAEARFENGVVDEKLGNPREAAQFYQGAIDVDPQNVEARAALGRMFVFAGLPQRALDTIAPVLPKHAQDARLLTVRAAAREQLHDLTGALADAQLAVRLAPDDQNAIAVLAGIEHASGDLAKTQALLESSVQRLPNTVSLRLALAELYEGTGQDAKAEPLLEKLVAMQPTSEANRVRLAQYYAHDGRLDAAEQVLRAGVNALPDNRDMKTQLISFLAAQRSAAAAEQQLHAFIAAAPNDESLEFMLAAFYEQGKQIDKAKAVYQRVIASQGDAPAGLSARDQLATLLIRNGNVPAAKALIAEVLAKDPRDDDALALRGNLALSERDPRAAIVDLRAVLRDQPNAVGVMRALARAHLENGEADLAEQTLRSAVESNPNDPGVRLDLAELLAKSGKLSEAKPVIGDLVKMQPGNFAALDAQFKIAMAMQDYATAQTDVDAILALQPKDPLGPYYQGLVYERQGRNDQALAAYTKALDIAPQAAEPLQGEIRVLIATHHEQEALDRLDQVIKALPTQPVAAGLKGEVLLNAHRAREAIAPLKLAITRAPQWAKPYDDLALAQVMLGDPQSAAATLRAGVAAAKDPVVLETKLAQLLVKLGRPNDAEQVYQQRLARDPLDAVAANNYAMLLVQGAPDAARLQHAESLTAAFANSQNPDFLDTYGWVLYKRGRANAAIAALRDALAKRPGAAVIQYHLGMAQIAAGQTAAARQSLEGALGAGQSFDGIDQAKRALRRLGDGASGLHSDASAS
ncbi:MAG: tetratricopeptide repeat protein [Gammaproteobacteria bacterium]|nr:tetratricopeptide repeat protein [Gammaproteobacteria bacterium]